MGDAPEGNDLLPPRAGDAPEAEQLDFFYFEQAQNGQRAWSSPYLMKYLGYRDVRSFRKVIQRAMRAWVSAGHDTSTEFIKLRSGAYKFTRTACFVIALSADAKKPHVARMQAYLISLTRFIDQLEPLDPEWLERVVMRHDLTDGIVSLDRTAKHHDVRDYGRFTDQGYRGMYNMSLAQLTQHKGLPATKKLLDHMGRTELAANLFRVTQTEEKIRNERLFGQSDLEGAAHHVGQIVRRTMMETSGTVPEALQVQEHVGEGRKRLRATHLDLQSYDESTTKTRRSLNAIPEEGGTPDCGYTTDPEDGER